jgi:hypothetical protein
MTKKFGADGDTTSWDVGRPATRNWAAEKRTTDERRAAHRAHSEGPQFCLYTIMKISTSRDKKQMTPNENVRCRKRKGK